MQLVWDEDVAWIRTQPVEITYEFPRARPLKYTPDVLIEFNEVRRRGRTPILCEVKYRSELAKNWRELRRKFRAAQAYCADMGWRFSVFDEYAIRTTKLENIKFLWRYRGAPCNADLVSVLLDCFQMQPMLRLDQAITKACAAEKWIDSAQAIWTWWVLVAERKIEFDMNEKISAETVFFPTWSTM